MRKAQPPPPPKIPQYSPENRDFIGIFIAAAHHRPIYGGPMRARQPTPAFRVPCLPSPPHAPPRPPSRSARVGMPTVPTRPNLFKTVPTRTTPVRRRKTNPLHATA